MLSQIIVAVLSCAGLFPSAVCIRATSAAQQYAWHQNSARFALDRARISSLCTDEVVAGGCDQLGGGVEFDGMVCGTSELQTILGASEEEAVSFLVLLAVDLQSSCFSCHDFCSAAVEHIPKILGTAAPAGKGLACIDIACHDPQVDVSAAALLQEGLEGPPAPPSMTDEIAMPESQTSQSPELEPSPEGRSEEFLRCALGVLFDVHPPSDVDDDEVDSSLLQYASLPGKPNLAFGPLVRGDRHKDLRVNIAKASAWIVAALRRLPAGEAPLRELFRLTSEEQVKSQLKESRRHLNRMLALMSNVIIKKGGNSECRPVVTAYVMSFQFCGMQWPIACGTKDKEGRHIIHVCDYYYEFDRGTQVGTLVHEASHHFGTDDEAYCSFQDCLALSSKQARNNADTYRYLVKVLAAEHHEGKEELYTQAPICNTECGAVGEWRDGWMFDLSWPTDLCGSCKVRNRLTGCVGDEVGAASSLYKVVCCSLHNCQRLAQQRKPRGNWFSRASDWLRA